MRLTADLQFRDSRNALIVLMCDKYIIIVAFVNTFLLCLCGFDLRDGLNYGKGLSVDCEHARIRAA
jgi:hypothetical protein